MPLSVQTICLFVKPRKREKTSRRRLAIPRLTRLRIPLLSSLLKGVGLPRYTRFALQHYGPPMSWSAGGPTFAFQVLAFSCFCKRGTVAFSRHHILREISEWKKAKFVTVNHQFHRIDKIHANRKKCKNDEIGDRDHQLREFHQFRGRANSSSVAFFIIFAFIAIWNSGYDGMTGYRRLERHCSSLVK